jgi:Ca2+-dependent lipid-binding protein
MPILGTLASSVQKSSSSYDSIASATGSGTNTITFSSIPATYSHLQLRYIARSTGGGDFRDLDFRINGGTSYKSHYLEGNGSSAFTSIDAAGTGAIRLGLCPASDMTSNIFAGGVIDILDYTNTNKNTTVRASVGVNTDNTVAERITFLSGLYLATTAVTSVTFTLNIGNFATGSQFALYGIRG